MPFFEKEVIDYSIFTYPVKRLVLSQKTGQWCSRPYPGHPKGCPNYGVKANCPPDAPWIEEYFDLSKPIFLVHSEFNLAEHMKKMLLLHDKWTERQCRNVLYWQSRSRAQLKERVKVVLTNLDLNAFTLCPEAMGLNAYATAFLAGLRLERIKDLKTCRHIALVGKRK